MRQIQIWRRRERTTRLELVRIQAALLLIFAALSLPSLADEPLQVVTSEVPPCVVITDQSITGFSVELWRAIAEELELEYELTLTDFESTLKRVESNQADVVIGCISVTAEREESLDFTHSIASGGFQAVSLISSSLIPVFSEASLQMLLLLMAFVVLFAHMIWLSERGSESISDGYIPGVFESVWFSIVTMSTVGYGDIAPKHWLGRISTVLLILSGVTAFGIIFGQFAADAIEDRAENPVHSITDFQRYTVGTKTATASATFLNSLGVEAVYYSSIEDAADAMQIGEVDIVLHDKLVISDIASRNDDLLETGPVFAPHQLGFGLQRNSALREPINQTLLKFQENGRFKSIYERWF